MDELEHVTLLGDTTAGSYSDNPTTEMHNGWMFSLSVGDFRAAFTAMRKRAGTGDDIGVRLDERQLQVFGQRCG